jgi:hypothetical protein
MRKLALVILIITTVISANAQKRFELDVTSKLGYYIPVNETNFPDKYFPENAFSPAIGASLGYTFFKSTGVFIGMEYCYLSPKMENFGGTSLDVTWQSFNVPFNIQQGIGKNFFITGGVTLIRQFKGYWKGFGYNSVTKPQELPEYNWQLGAGYKIKDLRISLQYYRGFKGVHKFTSTGESSWQGVTVKHQEVFVKLEYPLWKF